MDKIFDTIIIGGGPAGYTAALYAARAGLETLVLEKMGPGGQMALTGDIDNYPGFEEGIDGFTLGTKMQQSAERFCATTEYTQVTELKPGNEIKEIHTINGIFYAKTVILATGANPRKLGIPKERELIGKGIHYCAHCDGRFYKDKVVAVVGGGNSAAADALYLSRLAKKVYLIHRRDTLRATKIYHVPLMNAKNVEFIWNSTIEQLLAEDRLTGLLVKNNTTGTEQTLEVDALFVSIGRIPTTDFVQGQIELDANGYVIADETTKTNLPGVFAAGDLRTKALRQVVTAVADGATAAHYAEEYLNEKGGV